MIENQLSKIKVRKLKIINLKQGNVMRVQKKSDVRNWMFGEAYFSIIKYGSVKAWTYHLKMTLNLIVPVGRVKFVFFSKKLNHFKEIEIGEKKYSRITVPPKIWFGFKGMAKPKSIILNLANIEHNKREVLNCDKEKIKFNW